MAEKEYLNEEDYQKNKNKIRRVARFLLIIGGIVLIIGVILTILGFVNISNIAVEEMSVNEFDNSSIGRNIVGGFFGSFSMLAVGGMLCVIGVFLSSVSGILFLVAHRREIEAYTAQQSMPVVKERIQKMTPTVSEAAGSVAKSVSKGIHDGKKESKKSKTKKSTK